MHHNGDFKFLKRTKMVRKFKPAAGRECARISRRLASAVGVFGFELWHG
jgi:hypothetical protein